MGGRERKRERRGGGGRRRKLPLEPWNKTLRDFLTFFLLLPASSSLSLSSPAAARSPWRSPRARSVLAPLKSPKRNMLRQIPLGLREHEERNQMNPQEKNPKDTQRENRERERERERESRPQRERERKPVEILSLSLTDLDAQLFFQRLWGPILAEKSNGRGIENRCN
jgi:hypothetical protein